MIVEAGRTALTAHEGQFRRSGEPYITHPVAVATIVAELGLDAQTVAAALLHDAVEDTGLTLEAITADVRRGRGRVVDGVTKLDRLQFNSKEAQQAATIRKMLVAMADDWRVLADQAGRPAAQHAHAGRHARVEAAPHGPGDLRRLRAPGPPPRASSRCSWQLEDLAFATLHPKRYAEIEQMVAARAPQREEYLERVLVHVRQRLDDMGIDGRRDRAAQAPLVASTRRWSCGAKSSTTSTTSSASGSSSTRRRTAGRPSAPSTPSGPRSTAASRTTSTRPSSTCTSRCTRRSSGRTASRSRCRSAPRRCTTGPSTASPPTGATSRRRTTPRTMAVAAAHRRRRTRQTDDPIEFLETLKLDLEQDEVYVFTPKGEVIALPAGSTPVDFAYAIHTEVGHRCIGARVNGRLVPLETQAELRRHASRSSPPSSPRPGRRGTG